jgi:predicted transcriptional regulator
MSLPSNIRRSVNKQATSLLETGQRFARFDQIRQRHFWSDYNFEVDSAGYINAGDYKLFTTPSGQAGQGFPFALTDRETNWKSANRVPDNQNFEILEVGVSILPGFDEQDPNDPEVYALTANIASVFLQNTILAIQYLTNEISLGLCSDFAQASAPIMGSYISKPVNTAAVAGPPIVLELASLPQEFISNGFAAPGLRRRFKIPILLQHGETFTFNFKVPRAFYMDGLIDTDVSFIARMDFWATESFVERS